ncbi:MAG: PIN domain-containing protein [Burkholderiales bacterium]|nr:PIN domain-containing protein [Burkholderiales bacterium]
MRVRAFLDSNILIYAQSATEPQKRETARALAHKYEVVISTQVLSEVARVLICKEGMAASEVRSRLAPLAQGCDVCALTKEIVFDALRIVERYRYGFYDSQIIAAALASGAKTLFSEGLQHGQVIDGALKIRSPFTRVARQPSAD